MRDGRTSTTLGQIVQINPESTDGYPPDRVVRYVDLSSISAGAGIAYGKVAVHPFGEAPGRARRVVREGDVLVATVRPYLRGFALIPSDLDGAVASTGFAVLRSTEATLPGFVWALVGQDQFVHHLMERATGSNYPAVRPHDVASFPVDLPPLAVQRRIVDLVEAVSRCHEWALALASQAEIALTIAREALIVTADSTRAPAGLVIERIESGSSPITEGRPPQVGERAVVKLSAVRAGRFQPDETKALMADTFMPEDALIRDGDVIITRSNTLSTVGQVCRVQVVRPKTYLSDLTLRIRLDERRVDPDFFVEAMLTKDMRSQIEGSARGTSGSMRKISRELIRQYLLALPDLNTQRQVIVLLQSLRDVADAATAQADALNRLRTSTLPDLLSGVHLIPEAYDALLEAV